MPDGVADKAQPKDRASSPSGGVLPPRPFGARYQQQTVILARALGHAYFREWGRRAHGLHIAFSDVEFADFSIG
ncbi:hypothetical protein ACIO6T_43770 [Streptomyces sp. NPDC087532]|uniref:hypothetical protein n=1 Tax=unclassified Streptomyces TaxID=2593676 RepID=UPI0033247F38